MKLTIRKDGNTLLFPAMPADLQKALVDKLTMKIRRMAKGAELRSRQMAELSPMVIEDRPLFAFDHKMRIATMYGLWPMLFRFLREQDVQTVLRTVKQKDVDPERYRLDLKGGLQGLELRDQQKLMLQQMIKLRHGQYDCATGFGKSYAMIALCRMWPQAKIDIVSKAVPVVKDTIFPALEEHVGDIGIVGGGKNQTGHRVTVYVAKSLHKSAKNADLLIGDEAHELASDSFAEQLVQYQTSRNFGLSASTEMRWDGRNMQAEAVFGPVMFNSTYKQTQDAGSVVPIRVKWTVVGGGSTERDYSGASDVQIKRRFIWRNNVRNGRIAKIVDTIPDDEQLLITVDTVEHAIALQQMMPEFEAVYDPNSMDRSAIARLAGKGLDMSDVVPLTKEKRVILKTQFESGDLKRVIATTVWNVGVNFPKLRWLLRADGSGSEIRSVQIPGRLSRLDVEGGKTEGILIDIWDETTDNLSNNAQKRYNVYKSKGWVQENMHGEPFRP